MPSTLYANHGAALFVDIENAISHCSTLGIKLDMKYVCDKIKEIAPLRYRKAFGDIPKTMYSIHMPHKIVEVRNNLSANGILIQDIPYLTQHKNSADIHLVLDALSLAYDNQHIDHFAFMAIDKDFVPLYGKLKELGKTVIVISPDESCTSEIILSAADHLYYYERLVEDSPAGIAPIERSNNLSELKSKYISLLVRTCENMTVEGAPIKSATLQSRARQLRSDFDCRRAGYESFDDILEDMEKKGHISLYKPESGDTVIKFLAGEEEKTTAQPGEQLSPEIVSARYKEFLEAKLKSPLPSLAYRQTAFAIFEQTYVPGNSLSEWADKALPLIRAEAAAKNIRDADHASIPFKLLLSLYFSRAFRVEFNPMDKNNPIIHAFSADPPDLESFLLRHYVRSLRIEESLHPGALALLFFGEITEENTMLCERIIADVEFA